MEVNITSPSLRYLHSPIPVPWDWYVIYLHEWLLVDFYDFHVGKYTVRPMEGMGP